MAGLKKPAKKKDNTKTSPVLVIFLVFFILISIGLGVWGYYGYDGQTALLEKASQAEGRAKSAKTGAELQLAAGAELRLALGLPIDADDLTLVKEYRPKMLNPDDKLKGEKLVGPFGEAVKELKKDLGDFDEAKFAYPETFRQKIAKLQDELKKAQSQLEATRNEARAAQEQFAKLNTSITGSWTDGLGRINKGNAAALAAAGARNDAFPAQVELTAKIQNELAEVTRKSAEEREGFQREIEKLERLVKLAKASGEETVREAAAPTRTPGELHALMLDTARGKPLWDQPVAKIIRIDLVERLVTINIGHSSGARPELTFNIFGVGPARRAEGKLKGTCEIVRVVDGGTSIARITSLYDAEGAEIPTNVSLVGRVQRESENGLKEGDLLFNMTFGLRVAIAGYVPWQAEYSKAPAEQMRQLQDYMYFLVKQGVSVDAYLDLATAEVQGKISGRTRLLILGDMPGGATKEGEEKDKAAEVFVAMRKDAIEKGMFLISSDNMAVVTGYRKARNANETEAASFFRPGLPMAGASFTFPGQGAGNARDPRGDAVAPKEPAAKEMEKKEPAEKKDPEEKKAPDEKKDADKKDADKKDADKN